jgi:hypothetical protein
MSNEQENAFDWEGVVNQIFEMISADTAIIDRYGIILASRIKGFEKGRLLSPLVWDLIQKRTKLARELVVQRVSSLVIETDQGNIVVSIGENIYLLSVVPANVDLSQYMPSLTRFISTLDRGSDTSFNINLQKLNFDQEFNELVHVAGEKTDNFPIFKDLIKLMSQK